LNLILESVPLIRRKNTQKMMENFGILVIFPYTKLVFDLKFIIHITCIFFHTNNNGSEMEWNKKFQHKKFTHVFAKCMIWIWKLIEFKFVGNFLPRWLLNFLEWIIWKQVNLYEKSFTLFYVAIIWDLIWFHMKWGLTWTENGMEIEFELLEIVNTWS
jgi:hypothetical protein